MTHSIAYAERGIYAGWPANHGAWQWGDEFLVGFLRGKYKSKSMHNIAEPFEKMLARSCDGGTTWGIEKPNLDFDCREDRQINAPPAFSLNKSIIRVCGVYDHGGDYCHESGGFYLSDDKGRTWAGPYAFAGLEEQFGNGYLNTSRTRVAGNMVYLSAADSQSWGSDYTFCARHDGEKFHHVSDVLRDNARAVMPTVAGNGIWTVVAMRRRVVNQRDGWIDAVRSSDGGKTWQFAGRVGETGTSNGNPPALIALPDGRFVCCYANRSTCRLMVAVSDDHGFTWKESEVRKSNGVSDIGYPQLFLRSDGVPVVVYYWADRETTQQHIAVSTLVAFL